MQIRVIFALPSLVPPPLVPWAAAPVAYPSIHHCSLSLSLSCVCVCVCVQRLGVICELLCVPAPRVGALCDDARLTSVCRVHRA